MGKPGLVSTLALAAGLAAGPLAADWLVLADGTRLETRGAWSERGKLVVFKTADGTLSSLRLAEVDLEASRRAAAATGGATGPASGAGPAGDRPHRRRRQARRARRAGHAGGRRRGARGHRR